MFLCAQMEYLSVMTIYRCRKKQGKRKRGSGAPLSKDCGTSVTAHRRSPLYKAHISHGQFLLMAWCWVGKIQEAAAARFCDTHTNTVYEWYSRFRMAAGEIVEKLSADIWNGSPQMGGPGKTVQVSLYARINASGFHGHAHNPFITLLMIHVLQPDRRD